jgi:hypothetical protein
MSIQVECGKLASKDITFLYNSDKRSLKVRTILEFWTMIRTGLDLKKL